MILPRVVWLYGIISAASLNYAVVSEVPNADSRD